MPVVSNNTNELKTGAPGRFELEVPRLGSPMGAKILGHRSSGAQAGRNGCFGGELCLGLTYRRASACSIIATAKPHRDSVLSSSLATKRPGSEGLLADHLSRTRCLQKVFADFKNASRILASRRRSSFWTRRGQPSFGTGRGRIRAGDEPDRDALRDRRRGEVGAPTERHVRRVAR